MVITPRLKSELTVWTKHLEDCERLVSQSTNDMERDIHQEMAYYASDKILKLERELYPGA